MSNLPKTYKALRQEVKGKPFVLVDVEMKKPGDGEIVVKVSEDSLLTARKGRRDVVVEQP